MEVSHPASRCSLTTSPAADVGRPQHTVLMGSEKDTGHLTDETKSENDVISQKHCSFFRLAPL
jgi:hypothetical protein